MRKVWIGLAVLFMVSTAAEAKVNPKFLALLDHPIEEALEGEPIKEDVIAGLTQRLGEKRTLRDVIQTSRSRLHGEEDPFRLALPLWIVMLQLWLADNGLSIEMSDLDVKELSQWPDSMKYQSVREHSPSFTAERALSNVGVFTLYDLFRTFPDEERFSRLVERKMIGLTLNHIEASELRARYDVLKIRYEREQEAYRRVSQEFLSQMSPRLAQALVKVGICEPSDLHRYPDDQLISILGQNMRLVSELYVLMDRWGSYDSPQRCRRLF